MSDLTTQVLLEIRDAVRATNGRIDALGDRFDGLNERVDGLNERVDAIGRRQVDGEIRVATLLTQVAGDMREMKDAFLATRSVEKTVQDHELRLRRIETSLTSK